MGLSLPSRLQRGSCAMRPAYSMNATDPASCPLNSPTCHCRVRNQSGSRTSAARLAEKSLVLGLPSSLVKYVNSAIAQRLSDELPDALHHRRDGVFHIGIGAEDGGRKDLTHVVVLPAHRADPDEIHGLLERSQ